MGEVGEISYITPLRKKGKRFYIPLPSELLKEYDIKEKDNVEIFSCGEVS
jgi:bifunctional DNA-binding transcriptional regulator/antitoxin component of YhaV-PrlF toxin-antitoxin module